VVCNSIQVRPREDPGRNSVPIAKEWFQSIHFHLRLAVQLLADWRYLRPYQEILPWDDGDNNGWVWLD
jgi:hypothetical protein